jgi:asparagine synthase (glutamine-hydrolysing)
MCGIAGLFETRQARSPDPALLSAMAAALAHRGPDDEGIQTGSHWGLAARRLSIIGLESGHQPLSNEDGTIWVAFNGEIYNHRELRAELQTRGHIFSTSTDTEVLVHLYEESGDQLVDDLCGMFAFAIVDTRTRTLMLARDRLGQKPLNYCITREGTLAFASELASLRRFPGTPRQIDRQACADYFSLGYIPAPRTIFAGVNKLPPASVLTVALGAGSARLRRYWHPQCEPKERISFRDAAARTRELLDAAVQKRLEAEVPLGAFLSGGLDSTAITALMQAHLPNPVHTFTIGFAEPRYDERAYAQTAAQHLGTLHAAQEAEPRDIALLRRLVRHCGEPFSDSSILPTALLSQFARSGVTVALSGDGGDELFGGYQRYQVMALHRLLRGLPPALRRTLSDAALALLPQARAQRTTATTLRRLVTALGAPPLEAYMGFQGIFSREWRAELMAAPEGPEVIDRLEAWKTLLQAGTAIEGVERFMELDLVEYLPGDLLCKVDIASMMFSLEVRSPFMDHELIDFVTRLPRHYRVGLRQRKRLLRAAVADLLPPAISQRGKRGFGVPLSAWLRGELAGLVRETVLWQKDWDLDGLFNNATLRRLAEEHLSGTQDHSFRLWSVLCFRFWLEDVYRPLR